MKKLATSIIFVLAAAFLPLSVSAQVTADMATFDYSSISAKAALVLDANTGKILTSNNSAALWTPASLTKLVTAMVVFDTKPNLNKIVTMAASDEVGGARLATRAGTKYKLKDLLYDSLINSHNNTTAAVARSTGLSMDAFTARMDAKVVSLGARHSQFGDPTGMDVTNQITAEDMAVIAKAAFAYPQIRTIMQTSSYKFVAVNNKKMVHTARNTDKLLGESSFSVVAGKTGYLDESMYNFVAQLHRPSQDDLIVVVLGVKNGPSRFAETKALALWAWEFGAK
jgi:D-alanyl-D-alanine endopeptidase (penicillin-binding protein 7)